MIPSKTELPRAVSFSLWAPVRVRAVTQCHTGPSSASAPAWSDTYCSYSEHKATSPHF